MKNYGYELNSAANIVADISKSYIEDDQITRLLSDVHKKTDNLRPGLMFYGIYNAGKSTLLNALIGQELATMADRPETASVTEYDWNGYRIFDAPGIDAPIEHERISKEHLKKIEVVIFVVSTDGVFEDRKVYSEIGDIVASGKPLVLVLNNKSGLEPDSLELADIEAKVQRHLLEIGDSNGDLNLENKVVTVIVNAKSALKSRVESKNLLLEKSNILRVEDIIIHLMSGTDILDSVKTVVGQLEDYIQLSLSAITKTLESIDTTGVEKLRSEINDQKNRFLSRAKSLIDGGIPDICGIVRSLIESQAGELAITSEIEKWLSNIIIHLNELQDQFLTTLQNKIEKVLFDQSDLSVKRPDLKDVGGGDDKKIGDLIEEQALQGLKSLKADHLKDAFIGLRSMRIPGFKGRWEKTLGKWAQKSIPYVQIVIAVWELWRGWKSDNEQKNQARQQIMQINRAVDELHYSLKHDIHHQLNDWIKQISAQIDKVLDDTVSKAEGEAAILLRNQSELLKIEHDLALLLQH